MRIDIAQLEYIHPTLRRILTWIETKTGLEFTITSLYRMEGSGVHTTLPLRGTDLRMRNQCVGEEVADLINGYWMYDFDRPELKCCVLHGEGSNLHLHVQVHPNTKSIL